jgi:hypothetical protein
MKRASIPPCVSAVAMLGLPNSIPKRTVRRATSGPYCVVAPFAGIGRDVGVELVETIASPRATHVRYAVHKP